MDDAPSKRAMHRPDQAINGRGFVSTDNLVAACARILQAFSPPPLSDGAVHSTVLGGEAAVAGGVVKRASRPHLADAVVVVVADGDPFSILLPPLFPNLLRAKSREQGGAVSINQLLERCRQRYRRFHPDSAAPAAVLF